MYRYNPNVKYRAGNQTDENGHTNDDKMEFDLQNLVIQMFIHQVTHILKHPIEILYNRLRYLYH